MVKIIRSNVDIGIVCSNFQDSITFYRDTLGLPVVEEIRVSDEIAIKSGLAPSGFRQVRLKAGDTLIKLMQIQTPPREGTSYFKSGVRWITLFVDDINSVYSNLTAKGVEFLSEPLNPKDAQWIVCAYDPDGILIEFVEP